MGRQQLAQGDAAIEVENHLGVDVGRVDLADELTTPPARRQHEEAAAVVAPDGDDRVDPVLGGSHHGRDGAVLGAEPRPGPGVDADALVVRPGGGDELRGDVAEEAIADGVRVQRVGCREDQVPVVRWSHGRQPTDPAVR